MKKVSVAESEPATVASGVDRRKLSEPLGATGVAINRYRLAPGEGLPGGLHAHVDQEEIFVVLEGEATFETLPPTGTDSASGETAGEDGEATVGEGSEVTAGEVTVREGEAIRFAPGEFQSGRNGGAGELVMLAIGAPRDSEDVRVPLTCPDCGHDDLRIEAGEDGAELGCPDCGAAHVPEGCPECGHELRVTLDEGAQAVVACPGCGTEREAPPFAE